jgi:ribosomal protein S27AE
MKSAHGNPEKSHKCPKEGCAYFTHCAFVLKTYIKYMHDKLPRPKRGKRDCPECGTVLSGNHMRDLHLKRVHGRTDIEK